MDRVPDLLPLYLDHLRARVKAGGHRVVRQVDDDPAVLPAAVRSLCAAQPLECLRLIVRALREPLAAPLIRAIGDQLLEDLLNESSGTIGSEVVDELRTNKRFRQAFACGEHTSVDPAVVAEWVSVLGELGTTKKAERKSLWENGAGG